MLARPHVGNDVVDLDDPAIAHTHPRFAARVCHEDERARLAEASDPEVLLWCLFAAKEAAFKVVAKVGPPPPFAHAKFVVASDLRSVRHEGRVLHLCVHVDGRSIHAIASARREMAIHGVEKISSRESPSAAARRLAKRSIAPYLGCRPRSLEVVRAPLPGSWDGFAPPALQRDGRPADVDISLSHDGRFVAFAAALKSR